jgi:hypothetical protein
MFIPSHWDVGAAAEIAEFSGVKIHNVTEKKWNLYVLY